MIRDYVESDRSAVVAINAANEPDVGPLDDARLDLLVSEAVSVLVVEVDHAILGLMILLGPGGDYASPNYRWFSDRYDEFLYVDRVALLPEARGRGWGPALYERFETTARRRADSVMLAEVNTVPVNERSLRFHRLAGFEEVARCHPYGGEEQVAMLVKTLD